MRRRPEMRRRPDMTESPSTGSGGQSSVLCPDGLPVYREILCPHNTVIQSSRLSIQIFQQRTAGLPCCWAWSCSFIRCCSVMMAPRVLAICWSCCWSTSWNSFIRWASVRCTTWLRRASLVVVWWSMVTMSCSKDICSSRRAAGVAARASSLAATSAGGAMFSLSS